MEGKQIPANDFIDILELRANLVYASIEELKEIYKDDNDYLHFLCTLYNLLDIDNCGFAILDGKITSKIYSLLSYKRFELKDTNKAAFNLINELIIELNQANALDEDSRYLFKKSYLANQEKNRCIEYEYYNELLDSMGVDSFVIEYLEGEEIPEEIPDVYIIGSLVYLNNIMPTLFQIDEVKERVNDLINNLYIPNKRESRKVLKKLKEKLL